MPYIGDDIGSLGLRARIQNAIVHGWNAFRNKDPSYYNPTAAFYGGVVSTSRPDRRRASQPYGSDRTIATAIYNRIATDCASVRIHHCRLDYTGGFLEEIDSGLNNCLTLDANIDQTGRAFIQDFVMSMLDEGVAVAVPVDTTLDLVASGSFDIETMRVAKVVNWYPRDVTLEVYNDVKGIHEQIRLPKSKVAIVENPFYAIMNEPSSTMRRLVKTLAMMDVVDEQSSSGKLDLIIQLPYSVKSETRQKHADDRRKKIEDQLEGSKYGIAYIDSTERVTQLNRPVENNFMSRVEYLTSMLYSQLGMTLEILNGTASEDTMTNYYKRTIDVILQAIVDEFERKFLTKTARTQRQAIRYYRDPFSLTPTAAIADIADKFTRNEILSPNEVRGIVGFKPAADPKADELRNRNINQSAEEAGSLSEIQNEGENEYEV